MSDEEFTKNLHQFGCQLHPRPDKETLMNHFKDTMQHNKLASAFTGTQMYLYLDHSASNPVYIFC